ncbi:MAG: helix-hairpin-helix domain-containing protein [Polyangiales bacterium]
MKRRPSVAPEGANIAARITRIESRLALIEEAFTPSFRTLPSRLNAIETTISARVDQVMSAVGRMEVLSAQLEESEEELKERVDILQARGEGLERRFKESTESAGGGDEWREAVASLRKEITERMDESAKGQNSEGENDAHAFRQELAAIREALSEIKSEESPAAAEIEALKAEVQALKASAANAGTESLEARVRALEAMPPPSAENVLTTVKGIGPKYAKALSASGVKAPADIAAWTDEDVLRIAGEVGASEKKVRAWRTSAKQA